MLVTGHSDPPPYSRLVTVSNAVSNGPVSNSSVFNRTLMLIPSRTKPVWREEGGGVIDSIHEGGVS